MHHGAGSRLTTERQRMCTGMLKDTLWEIFLATGQIEAYLMYKRCAETKDDDAQ